MTTAFPEEWTDANETTPPLSPTRRSANTTALRNKPAAARREKKPEGRAKGEADSELRDELIDLAERGEIPYTVNHIKKASKAALKKLL